MSVTKRKDGFIGEKQINIPKPILSKYIRNKDFLHSLFITHIGYFPKASFHYRERKNGCEDYILLYSLGGKGYIETEKSKYELAPDQFIIIPPHRFHRYQADIHDPWTLYWVHFSSNKLAELSQEFKVEQFHAPTNLHYNEKIFEIWVEMYSSLASGYSTRSVGYANFCLYRFLSFFFFPNNKYKIPDQATPIDKSIEYMKANIDKKLTAEEIAELFQYSSSHYNAIFRKTTGLSPINYFIKMKIHYACQMLSQSELKIKEIAGKIGYDDPYYFSRLFKQFMNKSPKEYRKKV
jgi:AraC-like DNA-binding protein